MIDFVTKMREEVDLKLRTIETEQKNMLSRAFAASCMLEDVFGRLKQFVSEYDFKTEEEEIHFFREIKPHIFCRLLYYRKVYNIEMNRPVGTIDEQVRYLNGELELIQQYIVKRLDFYRYLRSGATHLDRDYFLRGNTGSDSQYLDSFYFERDPAFSTNGDFRVAKLLANDMLQGYLKEALEDIRLSRYTLSDTPEIHLDTPRWTDTKNGLIEILLSLDALGSIDGGNISFSRLTAHFEQALDVRLGNTSRAFNDIRFRNNPTAFLDRMKEALLRRMDELEEKNVRYNLTRNKIEKKGHK